jgi:hypothetical protein
MIRVNNYCETCGKETEIGRAQRREYNKKHPIYGTDFSKPTSVLISEIRSELGRTRGKLSDLIFGLDIEDRFQPADGGITCLISYLYNVENEFRELEKKQREEGKL